MSSALAFRLQKFCVSFAERRVLNELDLDIPGRGVTAVLGHSGSGKTTLLRCLNRLNEEFSDHRSSGSIWFGDGEFEIHARSVDIAQLRRRVGMVFQQPNPLPTSIARNLALPLSLANRLAPAEVSARVEQSLRRVGLWDEISDRLGSPASRLSGGQKQRLCLARALILEPEVLLLDEPTTALDFRSAARIEETLSELAQTYPLVLVSHSTAQAWRLAHRIVVLGEGRILAVHDRSEFADQALFQKRIEELIPE